LLGRSVDLHEFEPEAVASLVKLYLRELPENILTTTLLPKFNELSGKKGWENSKKKELRRLSVVLFPQHFSFSQISTSLDTSQVAHQAEAYPGFHSMK